MRSVYTAIESELHHNAVPRTVLLPKYFMTMRIDTLLHTPFRFKDVSPQMHHQQCWVVCYRNGKRSATTVFGGTCTVLMPNPNNRVTYKHAYLFYQECMAKHAGNCFRYHYQYINNHYITSEVGTSIIEPGDKPLEPCDSNGILRLESVRALPRVTRSKSIGWTNPMHPMTAINDESSSRKGSDMSELNNHDGASNFFLERNTWKEKTKHPISSG